MSSVGLAMCEEAGWVLVNENQHIMNLLSMAIDAEISTDAFGYQIEAFDMSNGLYNVTGQGDDSPFPDLISWAPVAVGRDGNPPVVDVIQRLTHYLENMPDEEANLVLQSLHCILRNGRITDVDYYDDSFIMHCDFHGKDFSMSVAVFNLSPIAH